MQVHGTRRWQPISVFLKYISLINNFAFVRWYFFGDNNPSRTATRIFWNNFINAVPAEVINKHIVISIIENEWIVVDSMPPSLDNSTYSQRPMWSWHQNSCSTRTQCITSGSRCGYLLFRRWVIVKKITTPGAVRIKGLKRDWIWCKTGYQ